MAQFYEWKTGDHICEVAQRFNLTCKELIEINHLTNIDELRAGDIIRVEKHILRKEDK